MDIDVQTKSNFLSSATNFDFESGSYKKNEIVKLQLNSTASSHQLKIFSLSGIRISFIFSFRKCFICRNELYRDSVVVSSNDRFSLFFERNVWIPDGVRCCSIHVVDHQIKIEDFNQIKPFSIRTQELSSEDVQLFLSKCQEFVPTMSRVEKFKKEETFSSKFLSRVAKNEIENAMYRKNRLKMTTVRERKRIGSKVTRRKKQVH